MNKTFNDLIHSVYDAAADPRLWPDVLDQCAWFVGARSCAIFDFSPDDAAQHLAPSYMCASFDASFLERYNQQHLEQEFSDRLLAQKLVSRSDVIEAISDELVYEDYQEFLSRANIRSLMEIGLRHRVIAFLNKDNLNSAQFTLQYQNGRGPAAPDELAHLNMLLPHIAKAIDLGRPARQLSFEHQSLLAAMDRLTIGVCILDSNGCEVLANDEFKRQQSVYKTLLSTPNGVLHFTRSEDQAIFESLKQDASKHGQFGARPRKEAIATDAESYLCIEVLPLARSEEMGSKPLNGFAVFSTDTGLPFSCNIPAIQAAYGLTDAEFALVDAIAEGLTNTQIAERRGRSVATINSQVKSILFKTQCSTRTQFVRLMMTFNGHYLA